jgi:hypothetical protein
MNDELMPLARELLAPTPNCALWGTHPALEAPDQWALGPVINRRDADLIEQSNARALLALLERETALEGMWEIHRLGHWAVGWVEHLSMKVLDGAGRPTPMLAFWARWQEKLEGYPIADEEDLYEAEYDAAIESIQCDGRGFVRDGAPADWASEVYRWLADHEPGQLDHCGSGASPSDASIRNALCALGFLHEDELADEDC